MTLMRWHSVVALALAVPILAGKLDQYSGPYLIPDEIISIAIKHRNRIKIAVIERIALGIGRLMVQAGGVFKPARNGFRNCRNHYIQARIVGTAAAVSIDAQMRVGFIDRDQINHSDQPSAKRSLLRF